MSTASKPAIAGLSHVFLSPDEVVAALPGISRNTLAMWRYERKGPPYRKIGRSVVYALDELEEWIEAGTHDGDRHER